MSLTVDENRPADSRAGDGEAYEAYRTVSAAAVVSCGLAVLSLAALLPDFWTLKIIPALGVTVGLVALVKIARNPQDLSGKKAALIGTVASAVLLAAGSAFSWYSYVSELPEGYTRISYETLKPAADNPDAASQAAAALDGRRVFIKGYMFPTAHEKVTKFVLCRDNGDCCFGGQPPKSDMVFIELQEPLQAEYSTSVRRVAGTLRIAGMKMSEFNNDILYRLEADYIR